MEHFTDDIVHITSWDVIWVELEPKLLLVNQLDILQGLIILAKIAGHQIPIMRVSFSIHFW